MTQSIFLQTGDKLVEMQESAYEAETILQTLLEKYPNLLAGSQMDSVNPRKWLFIAREAAIPGEAGASGRWALDHLFLDQEAIPTFVEVKRSTDTRIRREVVGQMLDYAANAVVYWPGDRIRVLFDEGCRARKVEPEEVLGEFLGQASEPVDFWQQVKTNLTTGQIRLVFVADEIPPELRRIVEFLNSQMDRAEVLAVEVKRYSGQGQTTYVPRLIGQTSEAEIKKRPEKRNWDETTFFEELNRNHGAATVEVARQIYAWGQQNTSRIWFGNGRTQGSFVPVFAHKGVDYQLFAVWTYGVAEIYFYWHALKAPFDSEQKRLELLERLNAIPSVKLPPEAIKKRPSIPLEVLDKDSLKLFFGAFEWFLEEVKKT